MERSIRILDLLSTNKSIKISQLAELLDVSDVTLRRDLDVLEKRGILCRSHGYASLDGADDMGKRLAYNHSIKRRIAKAAVQTIEYGETVMIESGSCCILFAEELALAQKNNTIITNSVFILNYISSLPGAKINILGGLFQPESQVLVGPMTKHNAECFYPDKFFLGTDGFVPEQGFTGRDHLRAETALALAERSNKVFILTESDKFHKRGAYSLIRFDKINGVFTDDKIPAIAEAVLTKNNVKVHKIPFKEEHIRWRQYPGQPPFLYVDKEE